MSNVNFWFKKDKQLDEVKTKSHEHKNKSVLDNIEQSSVDDWNSKQTTTGDLRDNITTFSQSKTRVNLNTGEKLSVTLGKIQKFLSDLKAIAFKDKVEKSDLETKLVSEIEDKYTKNEVDNKFSTLESNLDWKESVYTFDDIATTYPNAQDGWTVNVMDTNFTFRYNGKEWIAISANAIPKATQSVDGLLSKEDKKIVDDNKNSRHEHNNKTILDNINQTSIDKWNNAYSHISDTKKHINSDENGNINVSGFLNAIGGFEQNGVSLDKRYLQTFEIGENFNLDTVIQQGIYTAKSNAIAKTVTGRPSIAAFSVITLSNKTDGSTTIPYIQIAIIHDRDNIKIRRRNYDTDTWNDWFEVITDKNKSQFAKKYLQEDGWNDNTAITSEMLPSQFPSGLSIHKVYKKLGFPSSFGNLISIRTVGYDACQLFLEWTEYNNITGNVYYRSGRDVHNAFGPWKKLGGTDDTYSITKSLKLTTTWQDTGIDFSSFSTGTYIIQLYINDSIHIWSCYCSGVMSILATDTNDSGLGYQEIPLSQVQHDTHGNIFNLRNRTHKKSSTDNISIPRLEIKYTGNFDISNISLDCVFKFRKMI